MKRRETVEHGVLYHTTALLHSVPHVTHFCLHLVTNKYSIGCLQLASCRQLQRACCKHVRLQPSAKFQAKRAGSTHTERSFPPATVVAQCGVMLPITYLPLILLIASWWLHGAHTWSLVACLLEASGFTACSFEVSGLPASLSEVAGRTAFLAFGVILLESPSKLLQQHRSCSSCNNTAVAGMHSQGGWLLGHALAVVHLRLAWL